MIGQKDLIERLESIELDDFPKFIILVGLSGSGRKTLANRLYRMFARVQTTNKFVLEDVKVETIRGMISDAYKCIDTTFYIIPDADKMSNNAKNALLKVTEEPPRNAYFILTLENESNTLATIKSRAQVYRMLPYTPEQIVQYARDTYNLTISQEIEIIADICETPGEVNLLLDNGVTSLYDYVTLVADNIAECSGSNAFKIEDKIALKDEADKYDLRLFWKAFMKVCSDRMRSENELKYADAIRITSQYMQELKITGINKMSLFDCWILSVRESWL